MKSPAGNRGMCGRLMGAGFLQARPVPICAGHERQPLDFVRNRRKVKLPCPFWLSQILTSGRVKMMLSLSLMMLCFGFLGCQRKAAVKAGTGQETAAMAVAAPQDHVPAPANSMITGEVVKVIPADKGLSSLDPCSTHSCRAKVKVLSVDRYGMNYHGQFEAGDVLQMSFEFTLSPTEGIFPVLDNPLPGLGEGSVFTAEVFERPGEEGDYRIKLYEVKH